MTDICKSENLGLFTEKTLHRKFFIQSYPSTNADQDEQYVLDDSAKIVPTEAPSFGGQTQTQHFNVLLSHYCSVTYLKCLIPGFVILKRLVFKTRGESRSIDSCSIPSSSLIRSSWISDSIVGLSVGAMSIPQGMSYAGLAGLSIQYGLYCNMIYPLLYMMFGSSRHVVSGTASVENLMVGSALNSIVGKDADALIRANCAFCLAFGIGIVYFIFRLLKFAVISELIADPILSGFSTGSAVVVATSQLKTIFQINGIDQSWSVVHVWHWIVTHLYAANFYETGVAAISIAYLYIVQQLTRRCISTRFPNVGPLTLVIIGALVSHALQLHTLWNIKVVGQIPGGLPLIQIPSLRFHDATLDWMSLAYHSVKLAALYYILHISVAKTIAKRNNYRIDTKQELIAYGISNILGSFIQCYPPCTSVSRSSVTESLGAKTQLHGLAASVSVMFTLLFLTPYLTSLPHACLAAIILFGVGRMIELQTLYRLWDLQRAIWKARKTIGGGDSYSHDLFLWLVSFGSLLIFETSIGIIVAVSCSIFCLLRGIVRPKFEELGQISNTTCFRNVVRFKDFVKVHENVKIWRFDSALCFANAAYFENCFCYKLEQLCTNLRKDKAIISSQVYAIVVLDCSSIVNLDITAIEALMRSVNYARDRNVVVIFSNWKGPQRDFLAAAGMKQYHKLQTFTHVCLPSTVSWKI